MNTPATEKFLSTLKDFQRDTVDYVFHRMYEQTPPSTRFLVADEVGLGKTKVAAGVIARATDFLRANDPKRRIDIVYICSNSGIARQNIKRLNITGQSAHDLPDRITLLPRDIKSLRKNDVNFIAFTPGTSLNIRSSGGRAEERALLFWLLPESWVKNEKGAVSVLTGEMDRDRFQGRIDDLKARFQIDDDLRERFRRELTKPASHEEKSRSLGDRFSGLADQLNGRSRNTSDDERTERTAIVGRLRSTLAAVCVESLEPDLVILDEFQRFSDILHGDDEASQLARALFEYRDDSVEHGDVRVLLLSATPYRMFTTADEGTAGHYEDLIKAIGFLQRNPEATKRFEAALGRYGQELLRIGVSGREALRVAGDDVSGLLRNVMVRTERLGVTADRSGMLREVPCGDMQVTERDLEAYLATQELARALDVPDVIEYWKSAPYLVNFMDEYDLKRRLTERLDLSGKTKTPLPLPEAASGALLSRADVEAYRAIDAGNARLRSLIRDTIDNGAWQLLWQPPSWSYYQLAGAFAGPAVQRLTKRLIFSSWQVVPKVVAAVLTYEAERRMLRLGSEGEPGGQTPEARKKRRGLLRFSVSDGRTTGMSVLGLLYPSFTLATNIDPQRWAPAFTGGGSLSLDEVIAKARERVQSLLAGLTKDAPAGGEVDDRWYWAAPMLMDSATDADAARRWFGQANLPALWRGDEEVVADDGDDPDGDSDDAWSAHVRDARQLVGNAGQLGRVPPDLADVVALQAIAGPAVNALRALARVTGGLHRVTDVTLRNRAGEIAEGFRSLFNQPEVTAMVRDDRAPYWRRVLEYCAGGGLQAVLDEYAHVLVEHLGVSGHSPAAIEKDVSQAMRSALTLRTATIFADELKRSAEGEPALDKKAMSFRTHYAVRFGSGRSQEAAQVIAREGDVQKAFNSPFWPFVLCSTSVGQEGLDFHLYCHAVMHWNLPSNPVDLEQREGRVHRYKGHAVRKNVARDYASSFGRGGTVDSDAWRTMFDRARQARAAETSDLVPFWVYTTEGGEQIERHLPLIPLSKDVARADSLRRSLALYRMAFGQSRQDDLVAYLQKHLDPAQIDEVVGQLQIQLAPTPSPNRHLSGANQDPGDIVGVDRELSKGARRVGLLELEQLLDDLTALNRPKPARTLAELEQLLDDFKALAASDSTRRETWQPDTQTSI